MPMTQRQQRMIAAVSKSSADGQWFRARSYGDRVVLASLYRKGMLDRRAWRGKDGDPDAANEYRLAIGTRAPKLSKANTDALLTTWHLAVAGKLP